MSVLTVTTNCARLRGKVAYILILVAMGQRNFEQSYVSSILFFVSLAISLLLSDGLGSNYNSINHLVEQSPYR